MTDMKTGWKKQVEKDIAKEKTNQETEGSDSDELKERLKMGKRQAEG